MPTKFIYKDQSMAKKINVYRYNNLESEHKYLLRRTNGQNSSQQYGLLHNLNY